MTVSTTHRSFGAFFIEVTCCCGQNMDKNTKKKNANR
jgi:hypothetical protein